MRFAGRTLHNDGLVTDAGPGLRFSWRTTSGVSADGLREVTATGAGRCRVRVEQRVRPAGFDRVVAGPVQWILQRRLDADVRRLAEIVRSDWRRVSPNWIGTRGRPKIASRSEFPRWEQR